jgi:hypothetical protein
METQRRGLIIDFKSVAAYIAHESADIQAGFINTFVKELHSACQTAHHVEMQAVYIMGQLTPESKKFCDVLGMEQPE